MNFIEKEIINNNKKPRYYTIYSPDILKTNKPINLFDFLNIVVPYLNNNQNKNNNIIYSWNTVPLFRKLQKFQDKIESQIIDYKKISDKTYLQLKEKSIENESIKLAVKIWYAIKIRWLLWQLFYNYKIVRKIMNHLFENNLHNNINLLQIEQVLTNISNS